MRAARDLLVGACGPANADVAEHALLPLAELYGPGLGRWPEAHDTLGDALDVLDAAAAAAAAGDNLNGVSAAGLGLGGAARIEELRRAAVAQREEATAQIVRLRQRRPGLGP